MKQNEIILLVISIFILNTTANIMIKKGAIIKGNIFINRFSFLGYTLFLIITLISFKLLSLIDIKYFALIMSINYFMTYMAGILVFKEKTNIWGISGIIIVCFGLIVFNI